MTTTPATTVAPTIVPLVVPPAGTDTAATDQMWGVLGMLRVQRAYEEATWGYDDFVEPPAVALALMHRREYSDRLTFLAVADGVTGEPEAVVAFADVVLPLKDNTHLAYLEVIVDPARDVAALTTALIAAGEQVARERGRTTVMLWSETPGELPAGDPAALEAPTGSGRIDGRNPMVAALRTSAYVLEQAERYSVLRLPVATELLDEHQSAAQDRAGADYRLVTWRDRTPEERLEQFAALEQRMSTDVPHGELEMEEAAWDADRVRYVDESIAAANRGYVLTAAEHVPTGTLVAFTQLQYPRDRDGFAFQEDTLVMREHRGHRLGMLVKAENLRQLLEARPATARIHTWNAEENSYMLDINVALGFRPAGVVGAWQKKLGGSAA
jgi:GNAT superfamily N-acetyltransferase